jgi:sigma-B regulation protein RsbU (phosphoserine phosphatase)
MNKRSIAFQIGLYVLISQVLVFAALVFLNYRFSRNFLIRETGMTEFPDGLSSLLWQMILTSVSGILIVLLLFILIFRRTLVPLSQVIESIRAFTYGKSSGEKRSNEIELLADSLVVLQQKYTAYEKERTRTTRERRKYEKDLSSAREIQSIIIPGRFMPLPGVQSVDLFASLFPSESIGGDLYDYFFIDPNHLLFAIGDVSGKGIPAALFMAVAHTVIKGKATILSAMQIVTEVNQELSRHNANQHFLTLFLGVLDVQNGILNYCNAAHNYPFLVTSDRQLRQLDSAHGLPIGIYSGKSYSGETVVLREGDMLVLYTDGVTDCKDASDNSYGVERLEENISNMMELTAEEVVNRISTSLEVFRGSNPQVDDISLMAIRYLSRKN